MNYSHETNSEQVRNTFGTTQMSLFKENIIYD